MLALQLVIGTGVALLFPMLIYYGIATVRQPPKSSDYLGGHAPLGTDASDLERQSLDDRKRQERAAWQKAQAGYAKTLFIVMTPCGVAAIFGGYLLGVSAIGTGLLTGGILCAVYGYAPLLERAGTVDALRQHSGEPADAAFHRRQISRRAVARRHGSL